MGDITSIKGAITCRYRDLTEISIRTVEKLHFHLFIAVLRRMRENNVDKSFLLNATNVDYKINF